MEIHLSPNRIVDPDTHSPTLDEKITIFEEQVRGWQLDVARQVINQIPNSGFAVLAILMSYPEKLWQYRNGKSSEKNSQTAFREGMNDVFNSIDLSDAFHLEALNLVYKQVRCGMYHNAGTGPSVRLSSGYHDALAIAGGQIQINPHLLPSAFSDHLTRYVAELRAPTNVDLRAKFEAVYGRV